MEESHVNFLSTGCKDFAHRTLARTADSFPALSAIVLSKAKCKKFGLRLERFIESLHPIQRRATGALEISEDQQLYLKLITPNRPFAYPFGPAVKNSWLGLPFIPPPCPKASAQRPLMLMTLLFVSLH